MMAQDYKSTITVQSEVLAGVEFDIRKPSYGRKMDFDRQNADFREKVRQLQKQHSTLKADYDQTVNEFKHSISREIGDLEKQLASAREEERADIEAQIHALKAEVPPVDGELVRKMHELGEEALRLTSTEYNPARIRWGLAAIRHLEIDGEAATVESLIDAAPYEFTMEVLKAIDKVSGLSSEQLKNLQSPTTFSALVGTTKSDTTASAVSNQVSTETETAAG